jgi:hypothetical protein
VQTELKTDTSFKSCRNLNKMFWVFFVAWENVRKQDVGTRATLSRFAAWEGKQTGLSGGAHAIIACMWIGSRAWSTVRPVAR